MRSTTFFNVIGQDDNIGDSLLRRGLMTSLERVPRRVVYVGKNSDDYLDNVGLLESDTLLRSKDEWLKAVQRQALARSANVVTNAGEVVSNQGRPYLGVKQGSTFALVRSTGGAVIQTGVGVRNPVGAASLFERLFIRSMSQVAWRDDSSRRYFKSGSVFPDWGFSTGSSHGVSDRDALSITIRGDRDLPNDRWVSCVRSLSDAFGLTATVFVQVRRDHDACAWLAKELGGDTEFVPWDTSVGHRAQEQIVRWLMDKSRFVVSDRLHALILGATEGATPISLSDVPNEKIQRTLSAAGISSHLAPSRAVQDPNTASPLDVSSAEVSGHVRGAREALSTLSNRIVDSLHARSAS